MFYPKSVVIGKGRKYWIFFDKFHSPHHTDRIMWP